MMIGEGSDEFEHHIYLPWRETGSSVIEKETDHTRPLTWQRIFLVMAILGKQTSRFRGKFFGWTDTVLGGIEL